MKLTRLFSLGLLVLISISSFASQAMRDRSMKAYKLCDVKALATQLAAGDKKNDAGNFTVKYIADKAANYDYYVVFTRTFNADAVRGAVCRYINANKCYLYWGNVANIAMLAAKPAPQFPLDTSPHYMLSPVITCNRLR